MTVRTLLQDPAAQGVIVSAVAGRLDIDGPDAALTDELLSTLKAHKAELLAALRPEPDADENPEAEELCLVCHGQLREQRGKQFRHVWCPQPGNHFDAWRADGGRKLSETDAPIIRERG
jgi:TubC N-terminal docking domain